MSTKASTGPPLSATDNKLGWRREGKGVCGRGGPGLSCFPIYFRPPLLVSSFPCPHGFRKQKFFSPAVPLSGDNHLLFSVPHRQSGTASTQGVQKQNQQPPFTAFPDIHKMLSWVAVGICFPKHIKRHILTFTDIKSNHYGCTTVGIEASWTRACCVSAKSCLRVHYFIQSGEPRL